MKRVSNIPWQLIVGLLLLALGSSCRTSLPIYRVSNPPAKAERPLGANVLRVATFNLAHGRGNQPDNDAGGDDAIRLERLSKIAAFLKKQQLDVLILNEVDFDASWSGRLNQAEFLAHEAGFAYWTEQNNCDSGTVFRLRFGNAVLSRFPIEHMRVLELPNSRWQSDRQNKHSAVCRIRPPNSEPFLVIPVHLNPNDEMNRLEAATHLEGLRRSSDLPIIAAGSFHAEPPDFPYAAANDLGDNALTFLTRQKNGFHTLPKADPTGNDFTFPAANPKHVYDWILIPSDWQFVGKTVRYAVFSDHLPLIATIRRPE